MWWNFHKTTHPCIFDLLEFFQFFWAVLVFSFKSEAIWYVQSRMNGEWSTGRSLAGGGADTTMQLFSQV